MGDRLSPSFRHVNLVDKQDESTIINLRNLNLWKIFADLDSIENFHICIKTRCTFRLSTQIFPNLGRLLILLLGVKKISLHINFPHKEMIMMMEFCRQFIRTPHKNVRNHRELGEGTDHLILNINRKKKFDVMLV